MNRLVSALLIAMVLTCGGCSDKVTVTGRLVYPDGSAATDFTGSTVELTPVKGVYGSRGVVASDGWFRVSSDRPGEGTPPGLYKVVIHPGSLTQEWLLAKKYQSKATTPVEVEVVSGMSSLTVTIEKEPRKPSEKPPEEPRLGTD